jgi:phospholipase A1
LPGDAAIEKACRYSINAIITHNLIHYTDLYKIIFTLVLLAGTFFTSARANADSYTDCLLQAIEQAAETDTVKVIRQLCADPAVAGSGMPSGPSGRNIGLIENRLRLEQEASNNRFAIIQHKSSYILPFTYNSRVNNAPFEEVNGSSDLDNYEVKFQFSLKAQLFDSILHQRGRVFFGYTNQSYWQIYDSSNSGPFRETNHEPELFADLDQDLALGSWHIPLIRLGWVHQSNGRSSALSRSWNRIYGQVFLEKENWAVSFRPWLQVRKGGSAAVDNPDIDDFMGNFELGIFRQGHNSATSMLLRNNLRSENYGAVELNWSRQLPYSDKLRFYFQYFYGYGESLIDYNALTNRVSMGLLLSDFL